MSWFFKMSFLFIFSVVLIFTNVSLGSTWDAYSSRQKQKQITFTAEKHYNDQRIRAGGKNFRNDCSGFVHAVLWENGHSLDDFYQVYRYPTNGVGLIFKYVERVGDITFQDKPKKGDIVFFSNTYDKNKDGKYNDPLTHIGIVEKIRSDDTVVFLHYIHNRVRRGYMNLKKPEVYVDKENILNTYLRRRDNYTSKTLAAQLFAGFGQLEPKL